MQVQLNLESDRDHLTAARAAACLGNIWKTQEKNGLINCHNHCVKCVYIVVGMYLLSICTEQRFELQPRRRDEADY